MAGRREAVAYHRFAHARFPVSPANAYDVNRSAPTSLVVAALTLALLLLGFATSGQIAQLFGLLALALAAVGVWLGFVGVTVARAGAGLLALSVVAMAVSGALLVASLVLLVASA